ncbi:MAG: hypothetical protein M3R13_07785 [Armatimonadota bacterium]|nr:hypothetical protein [Armatimonadota bacterium]
MAPFALFLIWFAFQAGYENFELELLSREFDESSIPGVIISREARNDWPYGTSNGAFIRITWIVATDDPAQFDAFTRKTRATLSKEDIDVEAHDLGAVPRPMESEVYCSSHSRLYLFRVGYGRGQMPWEWSD